MNPLEEMSLIRMDSSTHLPLCSAASLSCDPQADLLRSLRARRLQLFSDLLSMEEVNGSYFYEFPDNTTCLHLACEEGLLDYIDLLLRAQVSPDCWNKVRKCAPIHLAAERGHSEVIRRLVRCGADVNLQNGKGRSALHLLAGRNPPTNSGDRARLEECVCVVLRQPNVDVNCKDLAGCNPAYLAGVRGNDVVAKYLINNGADLNCRVDGVTAEELLQRKIPETLIQNSDYDLSSLTSSSRALDNVLYEKLKEEDLIAFRNILNQVAGNRKILDKPHGNFNCLQYACDNGLVEFVADLLDSGADPVAVNPNNNWTPILYAASRGYYTILEKLIDVASCNDDFDLNAFDNKGETLLHKIVKQEFPCDRNKELSDHKLTLDTVLNGKLSVNVNVQDSLGYTPLHYAVIHGRRYAIKRLLREGANIGIKNDFGETAVSRLLPSTLEEFLDECVFSNDKYVTDKDFSITFRYSFLAPPCTCYRASTENDASETVVTHPSSNDSVCCKCLGEPGPDPRAGNALPETDSLWYMSQSPPHRHLLKHPVVTSFLHLKWQKISKYFYFNLFFYTLFVAFLTTYILTTFSSREDNLRKRRSLTPGYSVFHDVLRYCIFCFIAVLFIREVFQMCASVKRYWFTFENYLELTILILTFLLLFAGADYRNLLHSVSAILILFAWTEFFMLIGRHPFLSVYVTMFTTVARRFVTFLLWYIVLIIAFSLSFHLLFNSNDAFISPQASILKTIIMAIGELDFGDIPLSNFPYVSYIIFVIFVFLITVVLINLLNGLAVNDTGIIQEDAVLMSYANRVELVSYIESVLLGDPFQFLSNYPPFEWLHKLPDCAPCRFLSRLAPCMRLLSKFGRGTLLFYTCLPKKTFTLYPNRKYDRICRETSTRDDFDIDQDTVEMAKSIILANSKKHEKNQLDVIEEKMNEMGRVLEQHTRFIHQILRQMNQV